MCLMGKLCVLSLIGFLGMVLSGPLVALLSVAVSLLVVIMIVIAPFMLMGLAIWLPCRLVMCWSETSWQAVRSLGGAFLEMISGAVVGGLLGGWHGQSDGAIPIGLLLGAVVGAGVAMWNLKRAAELSHSSTPEIRHVQVRQFG